MQSLLLLATYLCKTYFLDAFHSDIRAGGLCCVLCYAHSRCDYFGIARVPIVLVLALRLLSESPYRDQQAAFSFLHGTRA